MNFSSHIRSRTVFKLELAFLKYISQEVGLDVYMFHPIFTDDIFFILITPGCQYRSEQDIASRFLS